MANEIIILGQWEKAKRAIAECKDIDEVKKIRDRAEALRAYAKQAGEGLVMQNNIAEIKLRCERKIGEFSKELPKDKGGRPEKNSSYDGESYKMDILSNAGINHYERYEAIANLPEEEFENYIDKVKESNEELTTIGVIKLAKKLNPKEEIIIPLPEGKFNVIYADPPWKYDNSGISGAAENHFSTEKTEKIINFELSGNTLKDLKKCIAENSVLFLWATNPLLKEALQVCEGWGFEYKTNIVWIKDKAGQGFYVKGQHELLLIGVRGSFRPDDSLYIRSVVEAKREKHSKKPDIFYEIIEKMYPDGGYLELFARNKSGEKKRSKWKVWGDEI